MSAYDFLAHLRTLDIQVFAEDGKLRISAPVGAVTPEIKAEITARKPEILSLFAEIDPIPAVQQQDGPPPLTLSQEHLYQLHRLTPDTVAYNMYAVLRLRGQLDLTALDFAFCRVAERHKVLRAAFPKSPSGVVEQVIAPVSSIVLRRVTLSSFSPAQQNELQSLIETEIRAPFDLSSGPLFRPTLVQLDPAEFVLILVMHHIIFDGHSFGILFDELEQAYRAARDEIDPALSPLPLQYMDYAAWQRKWLASDASAADRKYWQELLAGDVPALELPLDRPHSLRIAAEGDSVQLAIGEQRSSLLQEFCRREGITLFTAVSAAFSVLLHRHSGQRDLVVCTPAAARDRADLNRLIGYFNNTLVLRTDLSSVSSVRELLQQTQGLVMSALAHQMFPFKEVADIPSVARTPLSRAMVAVQDANGKSIQLPGVEVLQVPAFNHAVQYDLSLEVTVLADLLDGRLMYRMALFEEDTVKGLAGELLAILDEMLANPDCPIDAPSWEPPAAKPDGMGTAGPPYVAPRTDLERCLARIWQEVLQVEQVGIQDEFFELGGNSLLALRLYTRIEKETGTQLPLSTLFQTTTIARLADLIENEDKEDRWDCLVPIQPLGERPPLFLVHGIGGGVLGYRDLTNELGNDQPVIGLQAVGQDGRQDYDRTIAEMAARYISVMRSHQPEGPYRIGGYCFGGVVAYEMACQLEKMGERVSLLALCDSALADTWDIRVSSAQRIGAIWKSLPSWIRDYTGMNRQQLHRRVRSTLSKISSKLQRDQDLERRQRVEETLGFDVDDYPARNLELSDAHMTATLQYRPQPYHGIATVFRARNRSINEVVFGSIDPAMGWGRLAKGGVRVRLVDGYHRNMHLSPYAKSLAAEIRKSLDEEASEQSHRTNM